MRPALLGSHLRRLRVRCSEPGEQGTLARHTPRDNVGQLIARLQRSIRTFVHLRSIFPEVHAPGKNESSLYLRLRAQTAKHKFV